MLATDSGIIVIAALARVAACGTTDGRSLHYMHVDANGKHPTDR